MTSRPTDPQIKVTYLNHMGDDLTTVNAARVSFNKSSDWVYSWPDAFQETVGTSSIRTLSHRDECLIEYLGRHGHDSPMNHNALSVHVKMPIFVARQLVKHEYLVLNEISRRYVDSDPEFYVPEVWRFRAEDKKQGSLNHGFSEDFVGSRDYNQGCLDYYRELINSDICPEQARMVLPLSTMTEWHWSGLLSAWAKMVNQRIQPDTQYETQLVAQQVDQIASELWPHSWKALRSMNL